MMIANTWKCYGDTDFNTEIKVNTLKAVYIAVRHKNAVCSYTEAEGCCNDVGFI